MFVQVIRVKVKPDAWDSIRALDERWEREQAPIAPGFIGSYILREIDAPDRAMLAVLFESQALAQQNSDRPETNAWYRELLTLIDGEPEFIGTDVVRSYLRQ
jgi:quinol monooxygenase YgiN